jgi:hypothetical protein
VGPSSLVRWEESRSVKTRLMRSPVTGEMYVDWGGRRRGRRSRVLSPVEEDIPSIKSPSCPRHPEMQRFASKENEMKWRSCDLKPAASSSLLGACQPPLYLILRVRVGVIFQLYTGIKSTKELDIIGFCIG